MEENVKNGKCNTDFIIIIIIIILILNCVSELLTVFNTYPFFIH